MKIFYALLIAALFTTAACKKKDEAAKEPAKEPAAKPAEPPKAEPPPTPEPPKAEPAKTEPTPTEPPKAPEVTVADAGAKANALTDDKLVAAAKDAKDDCAKLGTALKGLTEEMKTAMAAEKEIEKDAAKKKEYEEKFEKPAQAKLKDVMKKLDKCKANADVKAFNEAMK